MTPFGSVQACLANAFCERTVEAKCNVCDADNHVQLTHKTTLMAPLPEVLVIHLKRWRMSRNQVKYVSHPVSTSKSWVMGGKEYDLAAVICSPPGHWYTNAIRQGVNGKVFIKCDDAATDAIAEDEVLLGKHSNLLFYRMRK